MANKSERALVSLFTALGLAVGLFCLTPSVARADSLTTSVTVLALGISGTLFSPSDISITTPLGVVGSSILCSSESTSLPSSTVSCFNSQAAGNLSTGQVGVLSSLGGGLPITAFSPGGALGSIFTGYEANAGAFVSYTFAVTGTQNGTAAFNISLTGANPSSSFVSGLSLAAGSTSFAIDSGETIQGFGATGESIPSGTTSLVLDVPIVNGVATAGYSLLSSEIFLAAGNPPSAPASLAPVDFLDPLTITSASVFDANGNLVPTATLTSQSGFNPNGVPAPEVSSMWMLGLGLLGLLAGASRRELLS